MAGNKGSITSPHALRNGNSKSRHHEVGQLPEGTGNLLSGREAALGGKQKPVESWPMQTAQWGTRRDPDHRNKGLEMISRQTMQ